jgi:hypothetical protein
MFAQGYGCDQSMWQDRPFRRTSRQFHDRSAAAIKEPERFETLTMVGPSPHYINETGYFGGFDRSDIDGLLESLESNHVAWSARWRP